MIKNYTCVLDSDTDIYKYSALSVTEKIKNVTCMGEGAVKAAPDICYPDFLFKKIHITICVNLRFEY